MTSCSTVCTGCRNFFAGLAKPVRTGCVAPAHPAQYFTRLSFLHCVNLLVPSMVCWARDMCICISTTGYMPCTTNRISTLRDDTTGEHAEHQAKHASDGSRTGNQMNRGLVRSTVRTNRAHVCHAYMYIHTLAGTEVPNSKFNITEVTGSNV
jgi:hypothetical protein